MKPRASSRLKSFNLSSHERESNTIPLVTLLLLVPSSLLIIIATQSSFVVGRSIESNEEKRSNVEFRTNDEIRASNQHPSQFIYVNESLRHSDKVRSDSTNLSEAARAMSKIESDTESESYKENLNGLNESELRSEKKNQFLAQTHDIVIRASEILTDKQETIAQMDTNNSPLVALGVDGIENSLDRDSSMRSNLNENEKPDCVSNGNILKRKPEEISIYGCKLEGSYETRENDTFKVEISFEGSRNEREKQDNKYSSSRLLFRIFLFGLFGLVILSLTIVYTIKYCICKRRKRNVSILRQRDLVSDSSSCHFQPIQMCMRPTSRQASLFSQHHQHQHQHQQQQQLTAAYFGQSGYHLASGIEEEPNQACLCRIPIRDRLVEDSIYNQTLSYRNQVSSVPSISGIVDMRLNNLNVSPPSYSDIFGSVSHSSQTLSTPRRNIRNSSLSNSPMNLAPNETSNGLTNQMGALIARDSDERGILVKLDLNKTRLLSPNDLMLLSKLIDVPIVIENSTQSNRQLDDSELGPSCSSSTTIASMAQHSSQSQSSRFGTNDISLRASSHSNEEDDTGYQEEDSRLKQEVKCSDGFLCVKDSDKPQNESADIVCKDNAQLSSAGIANSDSYNTDCDSSSHEHLIEVDRG